jgi:hypothetical protein
MLLSLFLLLVPTIGLSYGTVAGKHLDRVEGAGEDAAAFVFLCFLGVEHYRKHGFIHRSKPTNVPYKPTNIL